MGNDLEKSEYDCDVIVDISLNDDYHNYRYIGAVEGVEDTDFIYRTLSTMKLGEDKQRSIYVLADTQHTMLEGLPAEGFDLKENEIVISNAAAQRLGINIGDEITITIDPDTDFPIEKQMIVKETLNMEKIESLGTWTVIMNTDVYTHLFGGKILGEMAVDIAEKILDLSVTVVDFCFFPVLFFQNHPIQADHQLAEQALVQQVGTESFFRGNLHFPFHPPKKP